ncbi:FG-GAP repeat domain-containing protein [Streptomyces sp. NPDC053253]|uniref:FG-GAP repeat domain-containing protein n=1 Tax=Streptomyces sp. NPDC053253 TaxID=3365699 RepID=UPI0037D79163
MPRWGRGGHVTGVVAAGLLLVGLLPQQAAAATVPNGEVVAATIVNRTVDTTWSAKLTEKDGTTHYARDAAAVENGTSGLTVDIDKVLTGLNRVGRPQSECADTNAAGAQSFCWDAADNVATGYTHTAQGLTGSGEAPENTALVDGRRIVVASWYPATYGKEIRVTFADVTDPAAVKYRHVALVRPTATGFTTFYGHADSVTWYKNRLYVSTGAGMALFDLERFWDTNPGGTAFGVSNGTPYTPGYEYALPLLDEFRYAEYRAGSCGTYVTTEVAPPCFTGASLDLSGPEPALVTVEMNGVQANQQQKFLDPAVILRWPLDAATGLPRTVEETAGQNAAVKVQRARPSAAYTSTVSGAQGIAMNRGRFVVSAPCPEFVEGKVNIPSCLYHAWPGEPARLWTRTGINNENVSYWPGTDELWTINESYGNLVVFHIPWPRPELPVRSLTGLGGSLTGSALPDVIAIRPKASASAGQGTGNLVLYPGAEGGMGARSSIGTSWDSMRLIAGVGNLDADPRPDVLAVDGSGALWLYPGVANGLGSRTSVSATGWGVVTRMTGVGNMTGDAHPDLMAIWANGDAYLYEGRAGGLGPSHKIGTSWNTMRLVTGAGDLTGDGRPDVLAVDDAEEKLWLYPGDASGGLGARKEVSTGWGIVRTMAGVGDLTGDGLPDVLAVWEDGTARLYPGRLDGLGASKPVDLGWGAR